MAQEFPDAAVGKGEHLVAAGTQLAGCRACRYTAGATVFTSGFRARTH